MNSVEHEYSIGGFNLLVKYRGLPLKITVLFVIISETTVASEPQLLALALVPAASESTNTTLKIKYLTKFIIVIVYHIYTVLAIGDSICETPQLKTQKADSSLHESAFCSSPMSLPASRTNRYLFFTACLVDTAT